MYAVEEIDREAVRADTGKIPALGRLDLYTQFISESILFTRKKFTDKDGHIRAPKGPFKYIKFAAYGIGIFLRVKRLIRGLS